MILYYYAILIAASLSVCFILNIFGFELLTQGNFIMK